MNALRDLFDKIKEHSLTKTQLEAYHTSLTSLYSEMLIELAEVEKAEARFISSFEEEISDAARKRKWKVTELGQRHIELKHWSKATEKMLSSLKNRIYASLL